MRHGEAVQGANDSQRPLSVKGKQESAKVGQFLLRKKVEIDIFYHSAKQRSQETAWIVKDILNPKAQFKMRDDLAPYGSAQSVMEDIQSWKNTVMIVSHLPFLPRLISLLVTGREDANIIGMPTGSVVVLAKDSSPHWRIQEIILPEQVS